MTAEKLILLGHAAATLLMVGVIWMVQLVHYPLFDRVGADSFVRYQAAHMNSITPLVGVLMLAELFTLGLLLFAAPPGVPMWQIIVSGGLLALVWGATMFVSVPQHNILVGGFDPDAYRALVDTNWIRTLAWSGRGVLVLWMLAGAMG